MITNTTISHCRFNLIQLYFRLMAQWPIYSDFPLIRAGTTSVLEQSYRCRATTMSPLQKPGQFFTSWLTNLYVKDLPCPTGWCRYRLEMTRWASIWREGGRRRESCSSPEGTEWTPGHCRRAAALASHQLCTVNHRIIASSDIISIPQRPVIYASAYSRCVAELEISD